MESRVEDIVIVGAGIAGLTTSLGLHRLGVRSLVLESSNNLRVAGFAISIWTNAWKALDALGIGNILRQQHLQLRGNVTTSLITGQQISSTALANATGKHGTHEVRCVKQQLLLEALVNELPSGTIRFSSKVVAIEESGFTKLVHLADGTVIRTKVLIGSDGVNSVVAKWLGLNKAAYSGRLAIRGYITLTSSHKLEPMIMQFFGKGCRNGVIPCDDKTIYWFFTCTPTKQAPLRYRHPWELLFGNINKGNVCVSGDSFHPMTPDLGQGGCSALEDGVVLARCLGEVFCTKLGADVRNNKGEEEEEEKYKRIVVSLKKYANERRWRSMNIIFAAYVTGIIQQGESKLVSFFRDKFLASFLAGVQLKIVDFDCGKLRSS
ncbi:hypothetical protein QN277_006143 [Acacia crassicarpa]|uniref:FAD-binding domain-containing protein n=1 Tax=Acacia crassicarpa TaxID=499986 RepID=A0AAE1MF14_9FABA|nr:hypothetical protein QN277_006143 [Acacia crassicarpa]